MAPLGEDPSHLQQLGFNNNIRASSHITVIPGPSRFQTNVTETNRFGIPSVTDAFADPSISASTLVISGATQAYSKWVYSDLASITAVTTVTKTTFSDDAADTAAGPIIVGPGGVYWREEGGGGGGGGGGGEGPPVGPPCVWPFCSSRRAGGEEVVDPPIPQPVDESQQHPSQEEESNRPSSTVPPSTAGSTNLGSTTAGSTNEASTTASSSSSGTCRIPPEVTLPPDSTSDDRGPQPTSIAFVSISGEIQSSMVTPPTSLNSTISMPSSSSPLSSAPPSSPPSSSPPPPTAPSALPPPSSAPPSSAPHAVSTGAPLRRPNFAEPSCFPAPSGHVQDSHEENVVLMSRWFCYSFAKGISDDPEVNITVSPGKIDPGFYSNNDDRDDVYEAQILSVPGCQTDHFNLAEPLKGITCYELLYSGWNNCDNQGRGGAATAGCLTYSLKTLF
ncbi:MAG: hypothetical protein M1837_006621 [Sclerophora amabilis]|nr:MAG: hypothetical protein M1837_006621 [Sclerophora amabilis]